MTNAIKPDSLTAPERIAEVSDILAVGLIRMLGRQSREKSRENGESSLDISGTQSGHPTPLNGRLSRG
jgi:hypothetical protein